MKVSHHSNYSKRRRQEYPPVEEQLDALWKFIGTTLANTTVSPEVAEMLTKVTEVKRKYPSPLKRLPASTASNPLTHEKGTP